MALKNGVDRLAANVRNMERARAAFALDERKDRVHVTSARTNLGAGLATDIGEIRFESLAFPPAGEFKSSGRFIISRMRCVRNHAVFMLQLKVR